LDVGQIQFTLHGKSSAFISAPISDVNDLENLKIAINNQSNVTGITADLTDNKSSIILCNEDGYNIGIENFDDATTPAQAINIFGVESDGITETANFVALSKGFITCSLVGGHISLKSKEEFTMSSNEGSVLFQNTLQKSTTTDLESATVDSFDNASTAIDAIETALNEVLDARSQIGSVMNRLQHNASGLQNTLSIIENARSRREDTDFAAEMAKNFRARYKTLTNASITSITQNMSKNALQLI